MLCKLHIIIILRFLQYMLLLHCKPLFTEINKLYIIYICNVSNTTCVEYCRSNKNRYYNKFYNLFH